MILSQGNPNAGPDEFVGTLTLPNQPFRVVVNGVDANGTLYQRQFPSLFRLQTVEVSPNTIVDTLRVGSTTLSFGIRNLGTPSTFRVVAADNLNFVTGVSPATLMLNTRESATVNVGLTVPAGTALGTRVSLTVAATSTADPNVANSATQSFFVVTNRPPDTRLAQPSVSTLFPPNHKMVLVSILGVTDLDGDPVTIRIDRIMQDEPTNGPDDGDTCPDAEGVGTSTALLRAERSGTGNGRVYTIFLTATDGRGGSTPGSVQVFVPLDRDTVPVDDGPIFDSTVCNP